MLYEDLQDPDIPKMIPSYVSFFLQPEEWGSGTYVLLNMSHLLSKTTKYGMEVI